MSSTDGHTDANGKKLRSTCDRCAALKVRCNKQRPACERCVASREKCVYGPYRWKGRPASSNKAAAARRQARSPSDASANTSPESSCDGKDSQLPSPSLQYHQLPTAPYFGWDALHGAPNPAVLGTDMAAMPPWGSPSQFPVDLQELIGLGLEDQFFQPSATGTPKPGYVSSVDDESLFSQTPGTASPNYGAVFPQFGHHPTSAMPPAAHECRKLVLDVLQQLYVSVPQCHSGAGQHRLSANINSIKLCRAATQTLDYLLSKGCPSCFSDGDLFLLLRSACSITLSRYREVIKSMTQLPPSCLSLINPTPRKQPSLADYGIGPQVLLQDIQNLERVVAKVSEVDGEGQRHLDASIESVQVSFQEFLESTLTDLKAQVA